MAVGVDARDDLLAGVAALSRRAVVVEVRLERERRRLGLDAAQFAALLRGLETWESVRREFAEDNDDDQSYYVEEEITDEEAMEKQRKDLKASQKDDDPDADSDDSDMGFYMPSIISKDKGSPPKPKPQKITKKIRVKK